MKSQQVELIWKNLTLATKDKDGSKKILLKEVSGLVGPSTMTALLGTSGAGKTTLLNSLAGRLPLNLNLKGEILLNSHKRSKDTWSELIGYVEQEFYAYEYQTVFETLLFASKIKVREDISKQKIIKEGINKILSILGLRNVKNTYISQLSCGERKRVSIGIELLRNPPVLFCDEPTSGLDSFNALNILTLLKDLSNMGKTILVTIHQPSYEMLSFFDSMILMSMGEVVYDGNIKGCINFFKKCGYPLPELTNPADFFLNTISLDTRTTEEEKRSLKVITHIKSEWYKERYEVKPKLNNEVKSIVKANNSSFSFFLLLFRNISNYIRNIDYLKIKIFQKIFFILIFGFGYLQMGYSIESIHTRFGGITFIINDVLFGVSSPVLNMFPNEKNIILRERRSGMYSGFIAFIAKYCSETLINISFEMIYTIVVYWMIGLNPDIRTFLTFLIIISSVALFSLAYSLTIGAMSSSIHTAQILGSMVSIVLFIYSGSLNNPNTIPKWLRWIIWISPVYYASKAAFQSQLNGIIFSNGSDMIITGEEEILKRGMNGMGIWNCIFILWGIILLWLFVGSTILHHTTQNNIKMEYNEEEV